MDTSDSEKNKNNNIKVSKPNILMIMVDQMRFPILGEGEGFEDQLKAILGFQEVDDDNTFKEFFPGLMALRKNAVVLNNHRISSSACVPSRAALFTGQYPNKTGVKYTDGIFKDGTSNDYPWLDPNGYPTIGDWMRENSYSTHYFGKWHISDESISSLEGYGFSDWELSYPEPYGGLFSNLGYYRDYQFSDITTGFLRRQGLGVPFVRASAEDSDTDELDQKPWFAVASFNNPHDIGLYPGTPRQACDQVLTDKNNNEVPYALAVPRKGSRATVPTGGTMKLPLNPLDFPQDNADVMATWSEDLRDNNKPNCQYDYSYKIGLAFNALSAQVITEKASEAVEANGASTTPAGKLDAAANLALDADKMGLPFALTSNPWLATSAFIQYYGYLMHQVDQHISSVLTELEASGQAENTIVIFCPDHGEYSGSHHMMMEKWHTGYEEMTHVPLVVRFPKNYYEVEDGMQQFEQATSHADILPSILGFTGINSTEELKRLLKKIDNHTRDDTAMPVGSDFSQAIQGNGSITKPNSQQVRKGVLFVTYDTITEPFEGAVFEGGESPAATNEDGTLNPYSVFVEAIAKLKDGKLPDLGAGSIRQPNLVHCAVSNDNWKLVRYWDPAWLNERKRQTGDFEPQQFELYNLNLDPAEQINLLDVNYPNMAVIEKVPQEMGSRSCVVERAETMLSLLESLEAEWLDGWVAPEQIMPTASKKVKKGGSKNDAKEMTEA